MIYLKTSVIKTTTCAIITIRFILDYINKISQLTSSNFSVLLSLKSAYSKALGTLHNAHLSSSNVANWTTAVSQQPPLLPRRLPRDEKSLRPRCSPHTWPRVDPSSSSSHTSSPRCPNVLPGHRPKRTSVDTGSHRR